MGTHSFEVVVVVGTGWCADKLLEIHVVIHLIGKSPDTRTFEMSFVTILIVQPKTKQKKRIFWMKIDRWGFENLEKKSIHAVFVQTTVVHLCRATTLKKSFGQICPKLRGQRE